MFFSLGVDGTIQAVAVLWTLAGILLYASEDSRHSLSPCESFVFKWYSLVRVASDGQSKVLLQLPHILHRGHGRPPGHLMGTGWTPVKCQGEFSQPPAHKSPFCWPCDVLHFTVPFETKDSTSHEETTMAPWCFMVLHGASWHHFTFWSQAGLGEHRRDLLTSNEKDHVRHPMPASNPLAFQSWMGHESHEWLVVTNKIRQN